MIKVDSNHVLQGLPQFEESLAQALAGGATGVLLSDSPDSSGASLYEAASIVKELLRGRATLLVSDRIDIVDAADADGVLLTSKGKRTKDAEDTIRMCMHATSLICAALQQVHLS